MRETAAEILLRVGVRWQQIKDLDITDDEKTRLLAMSNQDFEEECKKITRTEKP